MLKSLNCIRSGWQCLGVYFLLPFFLSLFTVLLKGGVTGWDGSFGEGRRLVLLWWAAEQAEETLRCGKEEIHSMELRTCSSSRGTDRWQCWRREQSAQDLMERAVWGTTGDTAQFSSAQKVTQVHKTKPGSKDLPVRTQWAGGSRYKLSLFLFWQTC